MTQCEITWFAIFKDGMISSQLRIDLGDNTFWDGDISLVLDKINDLCRVCIFKDTAGLMHGLYFLKTQMFDLIVRHILEKIFDTRELSSEDMWWGSLFKNRLMALNKFSYWLHLWKY